MDAHLMEAVREGLTAEESPTIKFLQDLEPCARLFAVPSINSRDLRPCQMWAEFRLYFEGVAFGSSLDEGYVFSIDLFGTEKIRKRNQDVFALGQQNHSAGLEIETVRIRQVSQPVLDRPRLLL